MDDVSSSLDNTISSASPIETGTLASEECVNAEKIEATSQPSVSRDG